MTSGNRFHLARLRSQLKPLRLRWFPRLGSTNNHASKLRRKNELFAPAVVLTGTQLAGRGRNTNTWWSSSGSLTVTFVFPVDDALLPHQVPLIAGLAVRNAVAQISGEPNIQLKWPNDLLFEGRKIAGLLCERVHKVDLIGIGLNINQTSAPPAILKSKISALSLITGKELDKTDVLIAIGQHLTPMLTRHREHPFAGVLREYDRHHALIGRRVTITGSPDEPPISGRCEGLDSIGRLLLRSQGKLHRIIAGQVEMH